MSAFLEYDLEYSLEMENLSMTIGNYNYLLVADWLEGSFFISRRERQFYVVK